jgi:hypothetical protein
MDGLNAMADALSKINLDEVKLVSNELENGLTFAIINNMAVSAHAKRRGKERFNFKNEVETDMAVREALRKGKYVGLVHASDGNQSYLYSYGTMGVHVSTDYTNVNTLVTYNERYLNEVLSNYDDLKNKIIEIQMKEMKKLNRQRKKMKNDSVDYRLNGNIKIAELERKIYKSKSERSIQEYTERKEYIQNQMIMQEEDIKRIDTKIRKVGGALAYLYK